MVEENQSLIYGVKSNGLFHYIGKSSKVNKQGVVNKSNVRRQYANSSIRKVFTDFEVEVIPLQYVDNDKWFDTKLSEVVDKHKENNPLLNAQWMLDGKRGFWDGTDGFWKGKKRDSHTLSQLSISKYKKVMQYDVNGDLIKSWDSIREAAIKIFKDYHVKKGCGCSKLYQTLHCPNIKNRLKYGTYWFKEEELIQNFNTVPKKINIAYIITNQNLNKKKPVRPIQTHAKQFTVIHYNDDKSIRCTYDNRVHAAYMLRTTTHNITAICKNNAVYVDMNLAYGKRTSQPIFIEYPKYNLIPLVRIPKPKKERFRTKTSTSVNYFVDDKQVKVFNSTLEASTYFKTTQDKIYSICHSKKPTIPCLKFGCKIQIKY